MFSYEKKLQYPINVTKKDIRMAKYIMTQLGGPYGELGAALRYLSQRYTLPDDYGKAELTDMTYGILNFRGQFLYGSLKLIFTVKFTILWLFLSLFPSLFLDFYF